MDQGLSYELLEELLTGTYDRPTTAASLRVAGGPVEYLRGYHVSEVVFEADELLATDRSFSIHVHDYCNLGCF